MGLKLGKKVYVKINRNNGDEFFETNLNPAELSEPETTVELGEYQLVRKVKAVNKTIIE